MCDRYDKAFVGHIGKILGIASSNDRCGTGTSEMQAFSRSCRLVSVRIDTQS